MQKTPRYQRLSLVVFFFWGLSSLCGVFSYQAGSVFRLQHRFNNSKRRPLDSLQQLLEHDRRRHGRILTASDLEFPLGGLADPTVAGLYFTEIELGTPPMSYYVQVDTGSDLLWVNCVSCKGCPLSSQLGVQLTLYDPQSSSTSGDATCGDVYCRFATSGACQMGEPCGYQLVYGDGSTSVGYLVKDVLHLKAAAPHNGSQMENSTVVFGCGISQSGGLGQSDQAVDGIIGFGQSNLSAISQLANQNIAPRAFAHCLEGEGEGGGILVIGDVIANGLSYTSIIPNEKHYSVDLTTITVSGSNISIGSSSSGGTIFDSGTTLAYFTDAVYQQLLSVVLNGVPSTDVFFWQGLPCTRLSGKVNEIFPSVTFVFGGGSQLVVKPSQYLLEISGSLLKTYCVGFQTLQSNSLSVNILGDLVLKDRLVIYNLYQQRIGWVDYDCATNVTVSTPNGERMQVFAMVLPIQTSGAMVVMRGRELIKLWWLVSLTIFCCILLANNLCSGPGV